MVVGIGEENTIKPKKVSLVTSVILKSQTSHLLAFWHSFCVQTLPFKKSTTLSLYRFYSVSHLLGTITVWQLLRLYAFQ